MRYRHSIALALCLLVAAFPAPADVLVTVGFDGITDNNPKDTLTGEEQLFIDVGNDIGGQLLRDNQVRFSFFNTGPKVSSITDIYFDDGTLLGIAFLENPKDHSVKFSIGASPAELPGAENAVPPFVTTAGFSADADPPDEYFGIDPGERLGIVFDIQPGNNLFDVVDDLTSGALRVGIQVQGFESGGKESFVNIPAPEPATAILLVLAFPLLLRARRG